MLRSGDNIFFSVPGRSESRVLWPAKIIHVDGRCHTAAPLENEVVALEVEQDVFIYFELKRAFMKQAARIESIAETGPASTIAFETCGEPERAEDREYYRVSAVMSDLTIEFGPYGDCALLDVNSTGFSTISTGQHRIGETVDTALEFEDKRYEGKGRVQSVRKLDGENVRYGVLFTDDADNANGLSTGLLRLSMSIQRKQLRTQARTT